MTPPKSFDLKTVKAAIVRWLPTMKAIATLTPNQYDDLVVLVLERLLVADAAELDGLLN